jgi:hypothetical protein
VDDVIEVTQPGLARRFEDSRRRLLLAGAAIAVAAFATAFWVGRLRSAPESADATPAQTEKALHPEPPPSEPPVADPEPEQELEAAPLDPTSLPVAAEEAEPIEVEEPPKPVQRAAKSAPQKRKPGLSARASKPPVPVESAAPSSPPSPLPVTLEEDESAPAAPPAPDLDNPYAAELRERGVKSQQPAKVKPADCAQPYEIDERGIRRIKPACL